MKKLFILLFLILIVHISGCSFPQIQLPTRDGETNESTKLTINEVIETEIGDEVVVEGLVFAKNKDGFFLIDNEKIFIKYSNKINDVTVNKDVVITGIHIYENGHKILISDIEYKNNHAVNLAAKEITDSHLTKYISSFKGEYHVVEYIMIEAKLLVENNEIRLETNKHKVITNNETSINILLTEYINKNCLVTGLIYEYDGENLVMAVTDIKPVNETDTSTNPTYEDTAEKDAPTIKTETKYYHYMDVKQVQELTSYFEVIDNEDGPITVTSSMISGSINEGQNIITITVSDSDNNRASSTIIIEVGEYSTYSNKESILDLDVNAMPTTGHSKALVIPVAIDNYPRTESMRDTIEKAFFGTSKDTDWESLSSYYNKSSYGKLNITGEVTPWYKAKYSQSYYAKYYDSNNYIYGSTLLMNEALEYFKNQYDYSDFDSNFDGYIDAVYLIYNCPIGGNGSNEEYDTYWAYTYWDFYADDRNYQQTKGYSYVFMGYDFFSEELAYTKDKIKINCETLIHETGHLFNLDDYYDYDEHDRYNNDGGYCFSDMMDANFGDHGPLSKILLDWVDPVVINKDGIYQLPNFQTTGTTFVIGTDRNFSSIFSEYYLIDFYTFDGLNSLQNQAFFNTSKNYAGVRVSLVNAALTYEDGYYPVFTYNNSDTKYKLIQMLEADYRGNFHLNDSKTKGATIQDFYQYGDSFGDGYYSNFTSSDKNKIPFIMEVLDINNEYATVKITFKY